MWPKTWNFSIFLNFYKIFLVSKYSIFISKNYWSTTKIFDVSEKYFFRSSKIVHFFCCVYMRSFSLASLNKRRRCRHPLDVYIVWVPKSEANFLFKWLPLYLTTLPFIVLVFNVPRRIMRQYKKGRNANNEREEAL